MYSPKRDIRHFDNSVFATIILFSLWVGVVKCVFNLFYSLPALGSYTAILIFMMFVFGSQIYFFARRKRIAWMISAAHAVSIYFFSMGTFGYVLNDLMGPLAHSTPFLAGLLIGTEILKTFYFFRVCKH